MQDSNSVKISLSDNLDDLLKIVNQKTAMNFNDLDTELEVFNSNKVLDPKLQIMVEKLKSIKSTSTDSEKVLFYQWPHSDKIQIFNEFRIVKCHQYFCQTFNFIQVNL